MRDDAALVELAQAGDNAAFAELYERYFDRVYDFLARMVRDSSEAADLTQDTFLKAMNSLASLSKGSSFKSWLFTIARNGALNRLERTSRTQPLESTNDEGDEQSYDVVDSDRFGNPEEAAEAAGLASVVWDAANALEPKYRSVLMLTLRQGLDSAEIADVMGVTKNHAYVLVNRMKAALESAVGALALFRNGRRHCAELDAMLDRLQIAELTPEARRVIERHAGSCENCQEQRRKLASPFAIFAGMALMKPAPGLKESIFSTLQAGFGSLGSDALGGGASDGSPPSEGADASAGDGSQPGLAGGDGVTGPRLINAGLSVLPAPGGDGDDGGTAEGGTTTGIGDGEDKRRSRRRLAVLAAAAALLLLIGGPVAAMSFKGSSGSDDALAFVGITATTEAAAATGATTTAIGAALTSTPPTGTPTPTRTPSAAASPTVSTTASAVGAASVTATPPPSATPPPGTGAGTAPVTGASGPVGSTPAPILPGSPEPGIAAPPTATQLAAGPTPATGPQVAPPQPGAATATPTSTTPPTVTPTPCFYSMAASTGELVFGARNATQTFTLEGNGCGGPLAFTAQPGDSWVSVAPSSGSIVNGKAVVTVKVDVANHGGATSRVHVTSAAGSLDVLVRVEAPTRTPTPTATKSSGNGRNPCGVNCLVTPTPTPRSLVRSGNLKN